MSWNQAVHTDREVTANRPDIIIKNKKEKTCTLIDVAIPADRNVVQKEAEKKLKYKSLCIEIQRMWNMKCSIIPVIRKWSHWNSNEKLYLYRCAVHLDINVYVHQLMHLFISLRKH